MLVEFALGFITFAPARDLHKDPSGESKAVLNRCEEPISEAAETAVVFFPIREVGLQKYDTVT